MCWAQSLGVCELSHIYLLGSLRYIESYIERDNLISCGWVLLHVIVCKHVYNGVNT